MVGEGMSNFEVFKLNVDGAMFAKIQKVGVGAILRDEVANVIMAMSKLEVGWIAPMTLKLLQH